MKLHILNNKLVNFGFSANLDYRDKTFHGHQKGVAIALVNFDFINGPLEVYENYLPDSCVSEYNDKEDALMAILNDVEIVKLYQHISQEVDGRLAQRTIVYVPYYVVDHTCFAPTINFQNVDPDVEGITTPYKVDIELLFVCDGMNRYSTFHTLLRNVSIWDAVDSVFDHKELMESLGCVFKDGSNQGLSLDFYNEVGDKTTMEFTSPKDLKDRLVSFRLIALGEQETSSKA